MSTHRFYCQLGHESGLGFAAPQDDRIAVRGVDISHAVKMDDDPHFSFVVSFDPRLRADQRACFETGVHARTNSFKVAIASSISGWSWFRDRRLRRSHRILGFESIRRSSGTSISARIPTSEAILVIRSVIMYTLSHRWRLKSSRSCQQNVKPSGTLPSDPQ